MESHNNKEYEPENKPFLNKNSDFKQPLVVNPSYLGNNRNY